MAKKKEKIKAEYKDKEPEKVPLLLIYSEDGQLNHEVNTRDIQDHQQLYGYMQLFVKHLERRMLEDLWEFED